MWPVCAFWFLVGLTYSLANPAWKENVEYEYNVRGRTLTSLHEVSHQYSGIFFKASLKIQTKYHERLQAQIFEPRYAQIHSQLKDGWSTDIPEFELNWRPLAMSSKPFQIGLKQGFINDLRVSNETPNWEANIIKSIVSQFQLNTNGGESNRYDNENSATFVVMEDTVTGNTETLYKVNPLPDYIVRDMPNGEHLLGQKGLEQIYEVVKHKNYSNNIELPSYFYGFGGLEIGLPATNKMGYFILRNSVSRALLTGNMNRYTIQESSTINEVVVNPTLTGPQRGGVFSQMNVSLHGINTNPDRTIRDVSNPVHLGNLVYTYEKPSSQSNFVYAKLPQGRIQSRNRSPLDSAENYKNPEPEIEEAPDSPLLPYTMGYNGLSIKRGVNVVDSVVKLSKEIGYEIQNAEQMLHNHTLSKFTILSTLLKVMNVNEIRKATNLLYDDSEDGSSRDAWNAFRDSVAECGTGPALLVIQGWIQTRMITGLEASLVVSATGNAVRQPTLQFMKTFFDIVKNPKVQSQWPLNDTALLSYSQLVQRVYVVKKELKEQYPVKSFINFDTEDGLLFMKHIIIPYYTRELHTAILRGRTHRIHVLIRSLGNIGHPLILPAFEPYLEGKKQASQYQRLLMVVSMDRLAQYFKHEAKSVLFRIYQNIGETQEVRVAAVQQLMRIHPDTETLQLMAAYTNIDQHEHVNAAVKSSIESFARLGTENPKLLPLRIAAEQAKPLLTDNVYGIQYGGNFLRSRFMEEMQVLYKESIQTIGSSDNYVPKGIKYSLRKYFGGLNQKMLSFQFMVSSIDELVHVLKKQIEQCSQQQEQQKSSYNQQKSYQWSCQNIAGLLNMQSEELEQLEGSFYLELGHPYGMASFDNMTINQLPEEIRNLEDQYRNGKKVTFVKMFNEKEMAISFPTETGFPLVFTYDAPTVVNVKGFLKASTTPQISQNNKIHIPDFLQLKSDLNAVITRRVQSRVSFITPFDHQQYIAGFDKQGQIYVPVQGKYELDIQKMQGKMEIEPKLNKEALLYHYNSLAYTSRVDITKFEPVASQIDTRLLPQQNLENYEKVWGRKETGLSFHVQIQHKKSLFNYSRLKELFNNPLAGITVLWDDNEIQYSQINIKLLPQESTTQRIVMQLGYRNEYRVAGPLFRRVFIAAEDPLRRQHQQNILEQVSSGIKNVKIDAIDAEINFQGETFIKHSVKAAVSQSKVDPMSRLLINYKKSSNDKTVEPYTAALDVQNEIPNSHTMDLEYAMQNEPRTTSTVRFSFGTVDDSSASKIQAQFNFRRSEGRKLYLSKQGRHLQCRNEMGLGDKQLSACINQTVEANYLDVIDGKVEYQNLQPKFKNIVKMLYHAWRFHYFPFVRVDNQQSTPANRVELKVCFDPDLQAANVSVTTPEELTEVTNVKITETAKEFLVAHPELNLPARLSRRGLQIPHYGPFCVVDKTRASTFNNNTFPADISKYWTVMFQYVPKRARYVEHHMTLEEQMQYQTEHYAVLVRESSEISQQKDIKITLSSPRTQYKVFDVTMTPQNSSQFKAKVTVNNETVAFGKQESYTYQNGYVEIYGLPNGEIQMEVENRFHLVYDGTRVRLTVTGNKFKSAVRGICGQYDEKLGDLCSPFGCITTNSHKFIKSYEIEGEQGQQVRQEFKNKANNDCLPKSSPLYINVVTNEDSGTSRSLPIFTPCTSFQTRYVEQNGEICFSLQAMPVCQDPCQAEETVSADVAVHCVQQSNAVRVWKEQIDKGGNPDFSNKTETRKVSMQLPQGCSEEF